MRPVRVLLVVALAFAILVATISAVRAQQLAEGEGAFRELSDVLTEVFDDHWAEVTEGVAIRDDASAGLPIPAWGQGERVYARKLNVRVDGKLTAGVVGRLRWEFRGLLPPDGGRRTLELVYIDEDDASGLRSRELGERIRVDLEARIERAGLDVVLETGYETPSPRRR